ncbi:OmpA family protein [Jiulongibacter sp. NS-SX5]|uniref:OmpA family protein n=1 Tax=Jiulongibacter sp. NS-SX5 TaxID=3463854 RepID=UPI004059AFD8
MSSKVSKPYFKSSSKMSNSRSFILIGFIVLAYSACFSQDRKAVNFFNKGEEAFKNRDLSGAEQYYLKALERDQNYPLVYYKLGQIYYAKRDAKLAQQYYEKLLELDSETNSYVKAYTFLASQYQKQARHKDAILYFERALKNTREGTRAFDQLEKQKKASEFALSAKENAMVISPIKMTEVLNFKAKQYFPVFTADGQQIFFTARPNEGDENIYTSKLTNGAWDTPESFSELVNTDYNEGTCSISADGKTMVFTSCDGRPSVGKCDLYITKLTENGWTEPENLGPNVNSPEWDSQPALSPDGSVLVFSSDRFGGKGGKDLYVTTLDGMNSWTKAQNLGTTVNTSRDEISPFLHANASTLFYASNGQIGLGGYDIFLTEKVKGGFSEPYNLGYPINDEKDQFSMVIAADGKKGYYSVEEGEAVNLFEFELPNELKEKFNPTFYLKGQIVDAKSGHPLMADIKLLDLSSGESLSSFTANSDGDYLAVIPQKGNYALYVEHPDYFFKSISFSIDKVATKNSKTLDVHLDKIEKGKAEVLNNIYFDEGSWGLKPESEVELSKLAELIWRNPNVKVEISGHTDDIGNDSDNQELSQKRAQSVVSYLIKEGLNENNLRAKGFGESQPIAPNDSEENRQLNRRIELRFY